jgi:beta-1,4-mannosyltransferase
MGRISVVVLGDIGRSPRMQYHAISLANLGHEVDLIGYPGSKPHRLITTNKKIALRHLKETPDGYGLIFKCIWQAATLLWCLTWTVAKSEAIFLQNPPGLPAMFICWMVARLRGSKFVVDWHNFTWSILKLKWNSVNPIVKLVRWYEYTVGHWADYGLCVSKSMEAFLLCTEGIDTRVFYDRPLKDVFQSIDLDDKHEIMKRMAKASPEIFGDMDGLETGQTRFTIQSPDGIQLREDRPALLISSTSWTADEDFDILFDALTTYDKKLNSSPSTASLPKIVCVVTGKGPLKEHYLNKMPKFDHVQVCTPWLDAEDYPMLMASADLGVCLHTSSSGFDLPMKAVDMLGCRVPVLALKYDCIDELVKKNKNGRLFVDSQGLCDELVDLLTGFNGQKCNMIRFGRSIRYGRELAKLKSRLNEEMDEGGDWDWETNWKKVVEPILPYKE